MGKIKREGSKKEVCECFQDSKSITNHFISKSFRITVSQGFSPTFLLEKLFTQNMKAFEIMGMRNINGIINHKISVLEKVPSNKTVSFKC